MTAMHEFSLAERILESALCAAEAHGGLPVECIVVEIGALQQVVPEALAFAFDAAKSGTPAEDAVLEWRETAALIACEACGNEFTPEDMFWICPSCGAAGGRVLRGEELIIQSVTLRETSLETREVEHGN